MSDADHPDSSNVASHTLAYLRRLDRQQNEIIDLFSRQQDLITRLERDMRDSFGILQRELHRTQLEMREGFERVDRDLKEIKSDIILLENRLLTRLNVEYDLSRRIGELELRSLGPQTAS